MTVERYSKDQISQQDYPVKNDSARRIGRIGGKENFSFLPSQTVWFFSGILFFALLLRLFIAMAYQNSFDTEWYITWARGLQNGFFNAYDGHVGTSHYPLDYPPVYLYCLKLVGMALENPAVADYWPFRMLAIKFFPVLFDMLTIVVVYLIGKKRSEMAGLLAAAMWAMNPSIIFNCAAWGQTDSMMLFFLALVFWAFEDERPVLGAVLFAVSIATKMQCLYFAPVILFWFLRKRAWKELGKALAAGAGALLIIYLPFMIGSRNPLLIFEIYIGGVESYPYINANACNLWGLWDNNLVFDQKSIFGGTMNADGMMVGGFTYSMLGVLLTVGSIALVGFLMLFARRTNLWLDCLLLIQCLFMLTMRQHERYQISVLIFCLVAFLRLFDFRLFGLFLGLTMTTFLNQAVLLSRNHNTSAPWVQSYETIQAVVSVVNLLLFGYSVYLCIQYFTAGKSRGKNGAWSRRKGAEGVPPAEEK